MSTSTGAPIREELSDDDGFTLIELVISVAIVGFISVALTGIVLSYLRNTVDTQARLTESHDVQFAAAYWQRDVASVGVRAETYDDVSHSFPLQQSVDLPACGLPTGATAVVTLGWSEYSSLTSSAAPTLVKVTYAALPDDGSFELLRVRCGTQPSSVQVANSLVTVPTVVCRNTAGTATACTGAGADVPSRVAISLRVRDGSGRDLPIFEATLSGERRQT